MYVIPEQRSLRSLHKVRSGFFAGLLAVLILISLAVGILALIYVPWYQSVGGSGRVTVYSPMERSQKVDALIPGRVERWDVMEGELVRKGQRLGLLRDIDSKFLDPLQVQRNQQIIGAYLRKRGLNEQRLATLAQQRAAILQARSAALPAAEQRLEQSRQRQKQNEQSLLLAEQNLETDRLQFERLKALEAQGLRSRRDFELAQQALTRSRTDLERGSLTLEVAQRDIDIAGLEVERLTATFVNDLAKVQESILKTEEGLAEIDAILAKAQSELAGVQQRRLQQEIVAPCDGRVVRLLKLGGGETVKAGDAVCSLMPAVEDPAVELMVSGFDAPLVRPNQKVLLMFDGFPAIPFTAFPWAAVGTFGGRIAVVDAMDDGSGRYRVLIVPSKEARNIPWPASQEGKQDKYPLRPGTLAQGWIMMEQPVPLYWEVWRRLNAFPPVPPAIKDEEKSDKEDKGGGKAEKSYQPKPVFKR